MSDSWPRATVRRRKPWVPAVGCWRRGRSSGEGVSAWPRQSGIRFGYAHRVASAGPTDGCDNAWRKSVVVRAIERRSRSSGCGRKSKLAIPIIARDRLSAFCTWKALRSGAQRGRREDADRSRRATRELQFFSAARAPQIRPPLRNRRRGVWSSGRPLLVRRFEADQSVFLGDDYLIKGVAGAILWKLLDSYASGRPH